MIPPKYFKVSIEGKQDTTTKAIKLTHKKEAPGLYTLMEKGKMTYVVREIIIKGRTTWLQYHTKGYC